MQKERRPFFDAEYDGVVYRQEYRLDPRLLVPGVMLAVLSLPLVVWTWPARTLFVLTGLGVGLMILGFVKRHRFTASPAGYQIGWSVGPIGWTYRLDPEEAEPVVSKGRSGTYRVLLRRGWRTYEPLIEAASRREAEVWVHFLREVSHGKATAFPRG